MRKVAAFFQSLSLTTKAMKAANMRKPIRLYMPEHAMSTVNGGSMVPFAWVMVMAGVPDMLEMVECMPSVFTIVFEASELTTDRVEPSVVDDF